MRINRAVVVLNFGLYLALAVAVWAAPGGRFVLVLTNPAAAPGHGLSVVGRAGGSFVAAGRFHWMTVAYSEDADFTQRLMKAGALLVLNHQLALGCLKGNSE